jgi:hypothetical protein
MAESKQPGEVILIRGEGEEEVVREERAAWQPR